MCPLKPSQASGCSIWARITKKSPTDLDLVRGRRVPRFVARGMAWRMTSAGASACLHTVPADIVRLPWQPVVCICAVWVIIGDHTRCDSRLSTCVAASRLAWHSDDVCYSVDLHLCGFRTYAYAYPIVLVCSVRQRVHAPSWCDPC